MKTTENSNGKLLAHELCEFNQFEDVRLCVDWEPGTSRRDEGREWKLAEDRRSVNYEFLFALVDPNRSLSKKLLRSASHR